MSLIALAYPDCLCQFDHLFMMARELRATRFTIIDLISAGHQPPLDALQGIG